MKYRIAALTVVLSCLSSPASALTPYGELGIGLPELLHARLGAYVTPRVSVELYGAPVIFNWLVGAGATGYLLGQTDGDHPPRHAMIVRGTAAFNPTLRPLTIRGNGGETIGAAAFVQGGYGYTAHSGFSLRAYGGAVLYLEDTLAGGPAFAVSVGWRF